MPKSKRAIRSVKSMRHRKAQRLTTGVKNTGSLSRKLEIITKPSVIVFAILYAAGLFIVNVELARYSTGMFSLAQPQYVLVGFFWFLYTLFILVPAVGIGYFTMPGLKIAKKWTILIRFLIFVLSIEIWPLLKRLSFIPSTVNNVHWLAFALIQLVFFVAVYLISTAAEAGKRKDNKYYPKSEKLAKATAEAGKQNSNEHSRILDKWGKVVISGILSIGTFLGWFYLYTFVIYPNKSQIYGGGKHPIAKVVFNQPSNADRKSLQDMLGSIQLCGLTTKDPVIIVTAGTDFVVLLPTNPGAKPVFVRKDLVASVLYQ